MKKGGRVYNWIHLIGMFPIAFLTTEFGSLAVSSDGPGIALAPIEEIAIFALGIAGFLAWIKFFPKLTGGDLNNLCPPRRSSIEANR